MTATGWMEMKQIKEIYKEHDLFTKYRTKCKCGHSILITSRDGKELCKWCNNYVFATPELEKKYRLKEVLNKIRRTKD